MSYKKTLDRIYAEAERIKIDNSSKIVLMSDCHRGDGSGADNYLKNQNIAFYALTHYYGQGFTYIELGDGDELWANKKFCDIANAHYNSLQLLQRFHERGRFHMLYGNHDMVKSKPRWVQKHLYECADETGSKRLPLFHGLKVHEGVILQYRENDLFLLHGHQVDPLNYQFWKLSRFLVRYLWRPLELVGMKDPTSAQKNYSKKIAIEKRLGEWAQEEQVPIVAGHTHRNMFPKEGEAPYFNDGCCVHTSAVTAIELTDGMISLVKWSVHTRLDGSLYVAKETIEGPTPLADVMQLSKIKEPAN